MAIFGSTVYENITQVTTLFSIAEAFSGGTLGFGIWFMILIGSFFIMSSFNQRDAMIAATFVSIVTSVFLRYLGLLGEGFVLLSVILFIIVILIISYVSRGGQLQGA